MRAKDAAARTEELIRQSVRQSAEGEATAHQVAGTLQEIVGGVSQMGDVVKEIAATAKDQVSRIDGAQRAVAEVERVVQQNAASSEQASSAASELSAQAEELAAMVSTFQIDDGSIAKRSGGRPGPGKAGVALPSARAAFSRAPFTPGQAAEDPEGAGRGL